MFLIAEYEFKRTKLSIILFLVVFLVASSYRGSVGAEVEKTLDRLRDKLKEPDKDKYRERYIKVLNGLFDRKGPVPYDIKARFAPQEGWAKLLRELVKSKEVTVQEKVRAATVLARYRSKEDVSLIKT